MNEKEHKHEGHKEHKGKDRLILQFSLWQARLCLRHWRRQDKPS